MDLQYQDFTGIFLYEEKDFKLLSLMPFTFLFSDFMFNHQCPDYVVVHGINQKGENVSP